MGNDTLHADGSADTEGTQDYPYLTCEIGGGMPASYHRRRNHDLRDVAAVVLCQLGSGGSLIGYHTRYRASLRRRARGEIRLACPS